MPRTTFASATYGARAAKQVNIWETRSRQQCCRPTKCPRFAGPLRIVAHVNLFGDLYNVQKSIRDLRSSEVGWVTHTLTTRPKMLANRTETTGWRNDNKPNSSRFIVIHSPWDSVGCSSTSLDRPDGAGFYISTMHWLTNSCRFRLAVDFFDLCRKSSQHPGHKLNHLKPMEIIVPLRYF